MSCIEDRFGSHASRAHSAGDNPSRPIAAIRRKAARACLALSEQGFVPDIIVAHPGWGEGLYVKDVFPTSPLLNYGEFYYRGSGADLGFDPVEPVDLDTLCRTRTRNAHLLLALEA